MTGPDQVTTPDYRPPASGSATVQVKMHPDLKARVEEKIARLRADGVRTDMSKVTRDLWARWVEEEQA